MEESTPLTCPRCFGRLVVWDAVQQLRVQCACVVLQRVLRRVPAYLRADDAMLPESIRDTPPWPLTENLTYTGDWHTFRRCVWWALLENYAGEAPITLDVLTVARLRDIHFGLDPQYQTLNQLSTLDLLILVDIGVPMMLQDLSLDLKRTVRELRWFEQKPTWLFTPLDRTQLVPLPIPATGPALPAGSTVKALPAETGGQAPLTPSTPKVKANLV